MQRFKQAPCPYTGGMASGFDAANKWYIGDYKADVSTIKTRKSAWRKVMQLWANTARKRMAIDAA